MTDNLEQLERDWPQPRPKNLSTRGAVKFFLAMTILLSAFIEIEAVLVILRLKSRPVQGWYMTAFTLEMAVLLHRMGAIAFYRRIQTALTASGGSQDFLPGLQYHGIVLLSMIYLAIQLIFTVLMSVFSLRPLSPH